MIFRYVLKQHGKQTDRGSIALDKSCQSSGPDHCGIFSSLNFCKRLFGYPFT
jgi:hypothetical protein